MFLCCVFFFELICELVHRNEKKSIRFPNPLLVFTVILFFCEWDSSYSFTKCFEGNQPNSIFERKPQRSLLALFFISQDYKTFVVVFLLPPSFFSLFFFCFHFFWFLQTKKKRVVKVIGSSPEVRQLPLPFLFFSFCCWFWRVCGFYEFSKFYWAFFFLVFRKLFCRRRKNVQQIYKAYYKVINGRDRGKTKQTIFSDEMRAR